MTRILVVEDEEHLALGLRFNLEAEGYEVKIAPDGPTATQALAGEESDLVILDLMLPGYSGFEVLSRARAAGRFTPVLILTAKDSPEDRVRGLEEGADDYLIKPFHLDELLARVRGLLRRRRWDGVGEEPSAVSEPVTIGESRLFVERFALETPRGSIELTTRELGLLRALVDRDGEVATRGELLEEVWGLRPDTRTRVVDSFVVRLRRYLEADPSRPRHLISVRGTGYKLVR